MLLSHQTHRQFVGIKQMKQSLILLLFFIAGCLLSADKEPTDTDYQKIYYDYRALVMAAVKNKEETMLPNITDKYARKKGVDFYLVTISKLNPKGKWEVLLRKTDPSVSINPPKINFAPSDKVYIYKGKNFVLLESNKIDRKYKDNLHIRLVVKRLN